MAKPDAFPPRWWRYEPGSPTPAAAILFGVGSLIVGAALGAWAHGWAGWWGVASLIAAACLPPCVYLLVHRLRYGRWSP
jgi:hypothetical protein